MCTAESRGTAKLPLPLAGEGGEGAAAARQSACYEMAMSDHPHPSDPPPPRLFAPTAAQLNWVISIGFVALGYALYMRYLVIQQSSVGLACDLGLDTWLCLTRKVASALFDRYVFGWVSLGAAILNLIRPSVPLFTIALVFTAFGIVLYNASLSGFAAALLIICFARPVTETV